MKVILISGKAQHGKDTTAVFLKAYLERHKKRVLIAHYGDLVKYVCKTYFGWDGQKDEAGRSLLQRVGTDVIREQDENFWVAFVCQMLQFFYGEWDYVLIPDCRFHNEVEWVKSMRDVLPDLEVHHVRLYRPGFDNGLTPEQKRHPSETALDEYGAQSWIGNRDDLEALRQAVWSWAHQNLRELRGAK